jgi:NAD(P)-dependent dehydrogenase (short-subunit alcohol dehydrogenase family)
MVEQVGSFGRAETATHGAAETRQDVPGRAAALGRGCDIRNADRHTGANVDALAALVGIPRSCDFSRAFNSVLALSMVLSTVLALPPSAFWLCFPDVRIEQAIATNLHGTLSLTRLAVRQMKLRDCGGSIANISSVVGLRGYRGMAVYGATKGGVDAMTRALARELGTWKFRVNSVAPGYLHTETSASLGEAQLAKTLRRTTIGRLGVPDDIVGPIEYLISDDLAFITGQVLVVDGGITV